MRAMNATAPTDMELVERYLNGDSEAFEQILKRYDQKIFNFGLRMCRHRQDAEDLLQETFLNVLRYVDRFRGESAFKNWLYKIASSVCIKKRRKSKHQTGS
jgi:RNA polymerase sigma-70 factor (ECF subfamily)